MRGSLTASKLRTILMISIVAVIVAVSAGFYFFQKQLKAYATEISVLNADAKAGSDDLQALQSLQNTLEEEQGAIEKARSIVAESQKYQFQDQIVNDISNIASDNGVVVTQFNFAGGQESADGTTAPATSGAAAATPAADTQTPDAKPTPSSLKTESVSVSIESPLPYNRLMNFIRAIEQNSLKMQIASVSLTKEEGSNVTTQSFNLEVYVR
jgi:hypothetical protein